MSSLKKSCPNALDHNFYFYLVISIDIISFESMLISMADYSVNFSHRQIHK